MCRPFFGVPLNVGRRICQFCRRPVDVRGWLGGPASGAFFARCWAGSVRLWCICPGFLRIRRFPRKKKPSMASPYRQPFLLVSGYRRKRQFSQICEDSVGRHESTICGIAPAAMICNISCNPRSFPGVVPTWHRQRSAPLAALLSGMARVVLWLRCGVAVIVCWLCRTWALARWGARCCNCLSRVVCVD